MKKFLLAFFIIISFVFPTHANVAFSKEFMVTDGFSFEKRCAHGNIGSSKNNAILCANAIILASDAFLLTIGVKYNIPVLECYSKSYEFEKTETVDSGIRRLENYYSMNPSALKISIIFSYYNSTLNKYPIPKKCLQK